MWDLRRFNLDIGVVIRTRNGSKTDLCLATIQCICRITDLGVCQPWAHSARFRDVWAPSILYLLGWVLSVSYSGEHLALQNFALHYQPLAFHATGPRRRLSRLDEMFWIALSSLSRDWKSSLIIVKPETFFRCRNSVQLRCNCFQKTTYESRTFSECVLGCRAMPSNATWQSSIFSARNGWTGPLHRT